MVERAPRLPQVFIGASDATSVSGTIARPFQSLYVMDAPCRGQTDGALRESSRPAFAIIPFYYPRKRPHTSFSRPSPVFRELWPRESLISRLTSVANSPCGCSSSLHVNYPSLHRSRTALAGVHVIFIHPHRDAPVWNVMESRGRTFRIESSLTRPVIGRKKESGRISSGSHVIAPDTEIAPETVRKTWSNPEALSAI